jgi:hypothetical protein
MLLKGLEGQDLREKLGDMLSELLFLFNRRI